jgi:GTP-binding protein EngB required for normal cell division
MKTLELQQWTKKGQDLLKKAKRVLRDAPFDKGRDFASRIPNKIVSDGEALQVVFAGQYSAGKSSILKVMTGREDIEIGGPITTKRAQQLDWNDGIKVVDTPGVHTELRPDHDEITYEAISKAHLLVFVITNELFDSHIADHFRKLAVERKKAHEMLLVVNKMQRSAAGNIPEVQEVIREDIRKVLAPYTPEELRISFVDAETALEAKVLAEQDKELSGILQRKSGFDAFYDNFNAFVREKELAGRYTTSLYTLEQVLQEALVAESSDDSDSKALEEVLLQKRSILVKGKTEIPQAVESKVLSTTTKIQDEGRQAADLLHVGSDFEDADEKLKAAQDRIQEYADELSKLLPEEVGKRIKGLAEKVDQIAESELVKTLIPKLEVKIQAIDVDPQTLDKMKGYSEDAQKLGRFLVEQSFNPQKSWFKFRHYSGTPTHDAVKSIGHFFGKSFKPWEAVKWTRRIANAGRGLVVVGIFVSVAAQIKEETDAAKKEQELREGRAAIRAGFNDAAREVELHFDEATNTYVDEIIGQELAQIDKQLKELRDMQQSRSKFFQDLNGLLEDTRELISEMHSSEGKQEYQEDTQ